MVSYLTGLSAWELRELMRRRELSPVEVTEHFLVRIEAHDAVLGSFATLDLGGAREQAKRAERDQSNGQGAGLMHGIPISVKDCLASIDEGVEGLRFAWTDDFGFGTAYAVDESSRVVTSVRDAALQFRGLGADVSGTDVVWEDPAPFLGTTFDTVGLGWPGLSYAFTTQAACYRSALEARARTIDRLRGVLREHDLLLSPTVQAVAPTAEQWDDSWPTSAERYLCLTMMFNWVGWPALSVPCGLVDGLPVGLQIIGPPGADALVLRAARAFQAAHDPLHIDFSSAASHNDAVACGTLRPAARGAPGARERH